MSYSLLTLDGTLVLDDAAETIGLGTDAPVSTIGATAAVETAGDLSRRITASRIVLTGVFALAWRKKKDDRELYLTVQTSDTTMLARVDPARGEQTRRFATAVNDIGAGRAVSDSARASLSASQTAKTALERKVVEDEKVARMTPEEQSAYKKRKTIIGSVALGVIVAIVVAIWLAGRPGTFDMKGYLHLYGSNYAVGSEKINQSCAGTGGYSDIRDGAGVTVYNADGKIVGTGALANSLDLGGDCMFGFTVLKVPESAGPYQFEITHRGRLTVSETDAKAGNASATLGT